VLPWQNATHKLPQLTLSCCFSVYFVVSKCQMSQWPTLAQDLRGLPRKVLYSQPLKVPFHSPNSCLETGCHAVSSTNLHTHQQELLKQIPGVLTLWAHTFSSYFQAKQSCGRLASLKSCLDDAGNNKTNPTYSIRANNYIHRLFALMP